MSIDSASFIVSNQHVRFDEIMKISTKKGWVQALGGAFIFGGLIMSAAVVGEQVGNSIANSFFGGVDHEESSIEYTLPAYALYGVGVAMVLPGYHKIGKFRLMVISSNPNGIPQVVSKIETSRTTVSLDHFTYGQVHIPF